MKIGAAFGESIKTEKIKRRNYNFGDSGFRQRGLLMPLLLLFLVGILLYKLTTLQIFQGVYFKKLADSNRIRTFIIHAPRGIIFDRNGTPLVYNIPGFREVIKDSSSSTGTKTVLLSKDEALSLLAKGQQNLEIDSLRQYPYKDALAHVLGYIGQISKDELSLPQYSNYLGNDLIGKTGIEKEYEQLLRGTDGKQLIEVDAMGRLVRSLGQTDPIPGEDIILTIDAKLQQAAYTASENIKKGAVIVSKPDGEILAMVSKPSFDPNLFTLDATYHVASDSAYKNIDAILSDATNQPLLNRVIAGTYPPGSTFKLITAAAGLQDKLIDASYQIEDTGILNVGSFSFANWYYTQYGKKEGMVNIVKAIARSNDIFFYKLAELVGVDKISAMATKFGLGQKLGIDLGGEAAGVLPTKEWKKQKIGEDWYLGDTYHYGIGQGYLLTTPLQVNAWTQVIANNGLLYAPYLLKSQNAKVKNQNILSDNNISLIRTGMIQACSTGGVAWPLFEYKVKNAELRIDGKNFMQIPLSSGSADMRKVAIACKTGTAQHGGDTTLPHAWITLFAPAYNPEIVITVLSEESGEGSNVAGPIAKKILDAYFGK